MQIKLLSTLITTFILIRWSPRAWSDSAAVETSLQDCNMSPDTMNMLMCLHLRHISLAHVLQRWRLLAVEIKACSTTQSEFAEINGHFIRSLYFDSICVCVFMCGNTKSIHPIVEKGKVFLPVMGSHEVPGFLCAILWRENTLSKAEVNTIKD